MELPLTSLGRTVGRVQVEVSVGSWIYKLWVQVRSLGCLLPFLRPRGEEKVREES